MNKFAIKAEGIKKTYTLPSPTEILKGISFEVEVGEKVAIMGPSGVGKSTLLHILGTLEKPTAGKLFLFNEPLEKIDLHHFRNQKIGFIFQGFYLLEDYSVLENVLFPARIARLPTGSNSPVRKRAIELLDELGLLGRIHYSAKQLSGGEKQRVSLARALCNSPDLLLADEPSGNLDEENAKLIHHLLIAFADKFKKTLVVVTHNQKLAALCDRILYLENGVIQ